MIKKIKNYFNKKEDNLYYKNAVMSIKDMLDSNSSFKSFVFGLDQDCVSPKRAFEFFRTVEPLQDAVGRIADAIATLPLAIKEKNNDEYVLEHDILDILRNPSAQLKKQKLLNELALSFLLSNEAWLVFMGNVKQPPIEITYIRPENVDVTFDGSAYDGQPIEIRTNSPRDERIYYKHETIEGVFYYDDKDINLAGKELIPIIWTNENKGNQFRGMSPLDSIKNELEQIFFGGKHNSALLKNGMKPSYIFTPKEAIPTLKTEEINESFKKLTKFENRNKPILLPVHVEKIQSMITNVDADYLELTKESKTRVYSLYSIPLPLVLAEHQTLSNYGTAKVDFYDGIVQRTAGKLFPYIVDALSRRFKIDDVELTFNPLLVKALREQQINNMKNLVGSPLNTNEIRATAGYDDVPEGEEILVAANQVPLSSVVADDIRAE